MTASYTADGSSRYSGMYVTSVGDRCPESCLKGAQGTHAHVSYVCVYHRFEYPPVCDWTAGLSCAGACVALLRAIRIVCRLGERVWERRKKGDNVGPLIEGRSSEGESRCSVVQSVKWVRVESAQHCIDLSAVPLAILLARLPPQHQRL